MSTVFICFNSNMFSCWFLPCMWYFDDGHCFSLAIHALFLRQTQLSTNVEYYLKVIQKQDGFAQTQGTTKIVDQ